VVKGLWEQGYFKTNIMKPYELKQSLLDRMEIEALIVKIQRLEKELAEKELTIRILQKDLIYERSNADTHRVH
jgi:hypothetical protein